MESKVDEALGFDIRFAPEVSAKLQDFGYIERILLLLNYAPRPFSKPECKQRTRLLNMPEGWWNGSNFTRDVARLPGGVVAVSNDNGIMRYSLTEQGKEYVKSFIKDKLGS